MNNILMNIGIGIFVIVGFFVYWGRAEGWYKEGGLVYEWWKNRKNKKDKK